MSSILKKYITKTIKSILTLVFCLFATKSFSQVVTTFEMGDSVCKRLMTDVTQNLEKDKLSLFGMVDGKYLPLNITYDFDLSLSVIDEKENKVNPGDYVLKRDKDGNIFIDSPIPPFDDPKIFPQDKIIEINGKKLKTYTNNEIDKLFVERQSDEKNILNLKIKRDDKILNHTISPIDQSYFIVNVDFALKDLEIDQLNNAVKAFTTIEVMTRFPNLTTYAKKNFLMKENGKYYTESCAYTDDEINIMQLPRIDDLAFLANTKFDENQNFERYHHVEVTTKEEGYEEDSTLMTTTTDAPVTVKNNFFLKSFPFDKQVINFKLIADNKEILLVSSDYTNKRLDNFIKSTKIPGWKILGYTLEQGLHRDPTFYENTYVSSIDFNIIIQRSYEFYIFKIILPILLILLICWSVLWIDPKEIESRLTITIVCLLSLIAYNFVIDKDIPKLSYLTIMDYLILISYIYAAIPNFLSIASFKYQKTNPEYCQIIEGFGKKFGPISYVLIIFAIIIYAINDNPYTAKFLSGLI